MDIRESIRRSIAIREARDKSKWSPVSQPNLYALDNFLKKSGYYLVDIINHKDSPRELIIKPKKPSYLYPDIVHDLSDNTFSIRISDAGLYHVSDMEELLKGYTTALGVAKYLNSVNLSELEGIEEE